MLPRVGRDGVGRRAPWTWAALATTALTIAGVGSGEIALGAQAGVKALAARCTRGHHRCPARPPRRCPERGGRTLVENRSARVWFTGSLTSDSEGATLLGCLKSRARVRTLAETNGCVHECDSFGMVTLAAPYVAWAFTSSFSYGGDVPSTTTVTVDVYDLRAGRRVSHVAVYEEQDDSSGRHISGGTLSRLLLVSSGTAVLLVAQPGTSSSTLSVLPKGAGNSTPIDSGAVDPRSLRLAGHVLTWNNGGVQRSRRIA